jgi:hypothetical protein
LSEGLIERALRNFLELGLIGVPLERDPQAFRIQVAQSLFGSRDDRSDGLPEQDLTVLFPTRAS